MIIFSQFRILGLRLKSEKNCRDWETDSKWPVSERLTKNAPCHICGGVFILNSLVNWHPDPVFKGCHKECRDDLKKPEPKSEVSEKRLPPIEKRFLQFLEKVGYDGPKPSTGKKAEELWEVWKKKPTSKRLESDLKKTGYDGTTPETNNETLDKIHEIDWAGVPITEGQREKIKQICELIGEKDFDVPTGKMEASLMIDRLREKVEQMGIDVPKLNIGFWSDE